MPRVSVSVPHQFPQQEVIDRAGPYIEKMVEDFEGDDFELTWTGPKGAFSFRSLMFQITGDIEVTDSAIQVGVDLPFAAIMFKDKVEKAIAKNLTKALSEGGGGEEGKSEAGGGA